MTGRAGRRGALRALLGALCAFFAMGAPASGGPGADSLLLGFKSPPQVAKPRVWWHWMNGNVSEDGIQSDLNWMARAGIGGMFTTDIGLETPLFQERHVDYMSPSWRDSLRLAAREADRLGLEFGVFSSPGWSLTGGPWVRPEQAMKKLVWSRVRVDGGRLFEEKLPELPSATGPFQHVPAGDDWLVASGARQRPPHYSADAAIVAYREPEGGGVHFPARVRSSIGSLDATALSDGDTSTVVDVPAPEAGQSLWVQFEYPEPVAVRSVTVSAGPPGTVANFRFRDTDGKFRSVERLHFGPESQATATFAPVSATHFRFIIRAPRPILPAWGTAVAGVSRAPLERLVGGAEPVERIALRDLVIHATPRVHMFEKKAGFGIAGDYYAIDTPALPDGSAVPRREVLDLTDRMDKNGVLRWRAPPGRWVVLRMGYSLVGHMNHAAPAKATGLEIDKLNREYVQSYIDRYLGKYTEALGSDLIGGRGLGSLMMDSYEAGVQNWTDDMLEQFQQRRGYDPRPWLPVLTGVVVESGAASDRFLWDFRRTIADLLRDSHYGVIARSARQRGLRVYGEALETYRFALGDDLEMRRYADVPTGALWTFAVDDGPTRSAMADLRGAASIANIYGRDLVGGELLTSALAPWAHSPRTLQPVVDLAFALGVNRPMIHTSVHQPFAERAPGLSLSIFGQYFNRHETWSELARPWTDYLARSAWLLQQGRSVADIAYFYGEEAPLMSLFAAPSDKELPPGYGYDFVNADMLRRDFSVENGALLAPSGAAYKVLFLGGASQRMTLPVLRKLEHFIAQGVTVVGDRPLGSPSLADDPGEFERRVAELWGNAQENSTGPDAGQLPRVWPVSRLGEAVAHLDLAPDFEHDAGTSGGELLFQHRRTGDTHIYYLSNRAPAARDIEAVFRVDGMKPELWHARTGDVEPVSWRKLDGRTAVDLTLGPLQSAFVVFRERATADSRIVPEPRRSVITTLDGPWQFELREDEGAYRRARPVAPGSWSESSRNELRYFSGTARYSRKLDAPADWFEEGGRLVLDLGDVRELAQVTVNGQSLGVLWKPPFHADVTAVLRAGANRIAVEVTNLWVNRLIGDAQPGAKPRTFTNVETYEADAPLHPSGLLGPVTIERWSTP